MNKSFSNIYKTFSVARWQKFRPKSSKGAAEKKSWPKEFVAEFWLILPKSGRKGAAENFQKKFLIFSCDNHCENDVFGNWPSFFLNWPKFLDVLAGNFFGTWQHCPLGYSDFHNLMRFISKKMPNTILKNVC